MLKRLTELGLAAILAACALGQDSGQGMTQVQMTMKPSALTSDFKAMVIRQAGTGGGLIEMLMNPMMMMMGALGSMGQEKGDDPPFALLSAIELSWTKGETQTFWGQTFLAIYKIEVDAPEMSKMGDNPDFSNADMRLQFIRTDSIQAMTPRPDVTPESFLKMLKPAPKASAKPAPKPAK